MDLSDVNLRRLEFTGSVSISIINQNISPFISLGHNTVAIFVEVVTSFTKPFAKTLLLNVVFRHEFGTVVDDGAIVVPNEDTVSPPANHWVRSLSRRPVLWLGSADPFTDPSLVAVVDLALLPLKYSPATFCRSSLSYRIVNGFTFSRWCPQSIDRYTSDPTTTLFRGGQLIISPPTEVPIRRLHSHRQMYESD